MARYFSSDRFPPGGFNFPNWKDETFDAALQRLSDSTDPAVIAAATRTAHERLVDDPPWLYVVHDRNPRAMSPRVKGFIPAQSWFLDLSLVSVQ
jgi:peptide/nickel transport system substrate-binding protein